MVFYGNAKKNYKVYDSQWLMMVDNDGLMILVIGGHWFYGSTGGFL